MNPITFSYSKKYYDNDYEYQHVIASERGSWSCSKLLTEAEWRALGIQQEQGWVHYMWYKPEPTVFLFKRGPAVPLEPLGNE